MLLHWGQGIFCFWAIILSVRAIVLFLSDAFVRYVLNQYNLLYHKDQQKANQTLSAGISFLIVLSFILCTLIALILLFIPTSTAFIFDIDSQHRLISLLPLCLVSYLLAASVQNIQRLYAGTKESRGLVWHNMLLEVALVVLELSALSILLFQNFDFDIIVLADSVIILLVALIYLVHLGTQYPLAHILKVSSIQQGFIQFQKATQLYASNFFEKLSTDGLVLLLSFFRFDKAAIALFATVRTLVNTPLLAQNLLLNTYTPEMQKHFALRNTDALQQLLSFIRVRIGIILLAGMVFCLPFYEPIFIFWSSCYSWLSLISTDSVLPLYSRESMPCRSCSA
jgi:O-antigen/teichoic acid export membrane protein